MRPNNENDDVSPFGLKSTTMSGGFQDASRDPKVRHGEPHLHQ